MTGLCPSCGVPVRDAEIHYSDRTVQLTIEARPADGGDLVVMGWADPAVVVRVEPNEYPGEPRFVQHPHES